MSADASFTVSSFEQIIPTFIHYCQTAYEQDLETSQNMGTILNTFLEQSSLRDKLQASFGSGSVQAKPKVSKKAQSTDETVDAKKPRAVKAVEKYTVYDCYMKSIGAEWASLDQSEKDKWVNPEKVDKNGKVISAFMNYKSRWTTLTVEQKQKYADDYKASH